MVFFTQIPFLTLKANADVTTNTTVNNFNLPSLPEFSNYNNVFKVQPSQIASITNNGGQYGSSSIDKLNDGTLTTHWETGKPNSTTFTNEVVVTFTENVDINRIAYATRQDSAKTKGYPTKFEIYGNTDGSDNYNFVATGASSVTGNMVEMKFPKKTFKKLKFVFVEAYQNWASASEMWFYHEDAVSEHTEAFFTDRTHSQLVAGTTLEQVTDLEVQAMNHPLKTYLLKDVEDAKTLLDNTNAFDEYTVNVEQKVSPMIKAGAYAQYNAYQPVGLYAIPGQVINVYVEADSNGPLPTIVFTQDKASPANFQRAYALAPGRNTITVPTIYDTAWGIQPKKGGAIYIQNYYSNVEQPFAPKIRIDGASSYPLYQEGEDEQVFINELFAYKEKLDADNAAGTNQVLDLAEVNSTNMLLTTTATAAVQAYVNTTLKPSETTSFWNDFVMEEARLAGMDGSKPVHDATNLHTNIRLMQTSAWAYAAGNHIGVNVNPNDAVNMLKPSSVESSPWGWAHELGHQFDKSPAGAREWVEVTNNVQSANMSIRFNNSAKSRVPYETEVYPNVAPDARTKQFTEIGLFGQLGLFWQLQLFDDSFWADVNKLYRERKPSIPNEQTKRDVFIQYSSEALNLNLGEYFKRHGWDASSAVQTEIAKYPSPDKKIWYLNDSVVGYTGDGAPTAAPTLLGYYNHEDSKVNLSFNTDSAYKDDLLGYEILRGEQVIAFTTSNSFTDINNDFANNKTYTVKVYDKKLNVVGSKSITLSNSKFDYLSDMDWTSATSGWGTTKKDLSIEGKTLTATISGVTTTYAKGIGTHANSTITYDLTGKNAEYFAADIAVDKEVGSYGTVIFEVWADEEKVFMSDNMKGSSNAQSIMIPLKGVSQLKLVARDAGNGNSYDHADWLGAKLISAVPEEYNVLFDSQGGSSVESSTVTANELVAAPTEPTKEGHTFDGWHTEHDCIHEWDFNANHVTEDTTLYAKWTINEYTVAFDSTGGSNVESQVVLYNTIPVRPIAPTKAGYTFAGWYKEAELINQFDFAAPIKADTTVYVKWIVNPLAPTDVKAVSGKNSVQLSWSTVGGATGFEIYRSTSSTGTFSSIGTSTTLDYTDTGLSSNTVYYYKIRAYTTEGSMKVYSDDSIMVSAKTRK